LAARARDHRRRQGTQEAADLVADLEAGVDRVLALG